MDKINNEWRATNALRHYPFESTSDIPTKLFVDACLYTEYPISVVQLVRTSMGFSITTDTGLVWLYIGNEVVYNDYGKFLIGDPSWMMSMLETTIVTVQAPLLPSLCVPPPELSIMGETGDITIATGDRGQIETVGKSLVLSLPETTNFTHSGVSSINNQVIPNSELQITGDACTQIVVRDGLVVVDDICLPSCYDCNGRLTTGDVHLRMSELEQRTDDLEP